MKTLTPIEIAEIPAQPKQGDTFLIKGDGISDHTHGIFKYPCKFIPHIPRWFLNAFGDDTTRKYGVLDPFMGSGTTLVESSLLGFPAYGIDVDPLSKLLVKVKTARFTAPEIKLLQQTITDFDKKLRKHDLSTQSIAKFLPDFSGLRYWFSDKAIHELSAIKYFIHYFHKKTGSQKIADFLTITLASIVRKASKADEQSPKPYISTRIHKKTIDIKENYLHQLNKHYQGIVQFSEQAQTNKIKIIGFDARKIDTKHIKHGKVHLAMTSPPYINAFDYVRSLKLENFWLSHITEHDLSHLYDVQIGTEKVKANKHREIPRLELRELDHKINDIYLKDKKRAFIVADYFTAMEHNITAVRDALLDDGFYCIVVGDSEIRGIHTPTSRILIEIAERAGFTLVHDFSYIIRNRYLRIPRQGRGGFIPKDYILVFQK